MIGIKINGLYWLDLYSDTKLDVTLSSPVFSESVFPESTIYNFEVPHSSKNAAALGYPGRMLVKTTSLATNKIEVYWFNKFIGSGIAVIRKVTKNRIEIVAGLNESSFYALFGDKKITDFSYGGERLFYADTDVVRDNVIAKVAGKTQAESDWAFFCVNNPSLYAAVVGEPEENVYFNRGYFRSTYDNTYARPYQNDYFPGQWPTNPSAIPRTNKSSITPFPYLGYVVKQIFEESGYSVVQNDLFHHPDLSKICIYNPNITPVRRVSMNNYICYIHLDEHLPDLTTAEFFAAIKKPLALSFSVNENLRSASIRTFNSYDDKRIKPTLETTEIEFEDSKKLKFKLRVDGSDQYTSNWIKADEIETARNRGTVTLIIDLVSITNPVIGDIALTIEDNYFYRYAQTDEGVFEWQKFAYNIQHVLVGDSKEVVEIETSYSSVYSESRVVKHLVGPGELDFVDDVWCTPRVDIQGNMRKQGIVPRIPYSNFELKLMLNWGMDLSDSYNIAYPAGSGSGIKYAGSAPPDRNFSLIPFHPNSFVEKILSKQNESLKNKSVLRAKRIMGINELNEIDFLRTELTNGRTWLIDKVKFSLTNTGVSVVEIDYIQISV